MFEHCLAGGCLCPEVYRKFPYLASHCVVRYEEVRFEQRGSLCCSFFQVLIRGVAVNGRPNFLHSWQLLSTKPTPAIALLIMTKYLFLCGVGRSGTTVFRTALGRHPEIYYNGKENNAVHEILNVAQRNCTMESRKFAMQVDQDRYDEIFRNTIEALTWPDEQRRLLPARLAAINPAGEQLDYLRQVFSGSKIICLVRNGIEVVSSRMAFASFAKGSFESHCNVWNRSQPVIVWGQNHSDHFRLIRQEWFYDREILKDRLDDVFQWAGLSLSDQTLDHITQTLPRIPQTDQRPLHRKNLHRHLRLRRSNIFSPNAIDGEVGLLINAECSSTNAATLCSNWDTKYHGRLRLLPKPNF